MGNIKITENAVGCKILHVLQIVFISIHNVIIQLFTTKKLLTTNMVD